jgi:hypothetical protein
LICIWNAKGRIMTEMSRGRRCAGFLLVLVAALVALGCATSTPPISTSAFGVPCLPPGIPPGFFAWPVVGFRPLVLQSDRGESVPVFWVLYRRGDTGVAAVWTETDLLTIDPSPDTDDPEWVDGAIVDDEGDALVILTDPKTPCQWHRYKEGRERV